MDKTTLKRLLNGADLYKLKKEQLSLALKLCGLNTNVTVHEGRRLLSQYFSDKNRAISEVAVSI